MIFISVGTQAKGFLRLLNAVEELIRKYNITEEVVAQIGNSKFQSDNIKCYPFVSENEFKEYVNNASLIITHAGSGALFSAIKTGKKVIAVARLKKYNEMIDDHQLELLDKLVEGGYILDGTESLEDAYKKIPDFIPRSNDFKNDIEESLTEAINGWLNQI